jgi:hypothetical protein
MLICDQLLATDIIITLLTEADRFISFINTRESFISEYVLMKNVC